MKYILTAEDKDDFLAPDEEDQSSKTEITVSKSDFEKYNINSENPSPLKIAEVAFLKFTSTMEGSKLYGDPFVKKGATLEQAWRTNSLFTGKLPICLFAEGRPNVKTNTIKPLVKLNPKELVKTLSGLVESLRITIPIVVYNGKLGHSIVLEKHYKENSTFIYLDPWPKSTLLRKENNTIGIDAKRIGKQLWSINDNELEKVIIAAFVWQHFWAEYNHQKYYNSFNEFKNSDFWSFFNLREIDTQRLENSEKISLKTGGFQSYIDLNIIVNSNGRIIEGELKVNRNWIEGKEKRVVEEPPILNPFALDIVRSFIITLTPPLDRPQTVDLIQTLDKARNSEEALKFIDTQPPQTIPNIAFFVYLGLVESVNVKLEFCKITMTNTVSDNEQYLQVTAKADEFYSTFT